MKPARLVFPGLAALIALGGCSERVIATANDEVLVVVEDIQRDDPVATATVHYVMASPQPLSDDAAPAERVVRMRYEARFDCSRLLWGEKIQELTLIDGRVLTNRNPEPVFEEPTLGSVGESALGAVCDRDFYSTRGSSRPLHSIEKDYLEQIARR